MKPAAVDPVLEALADQHAELGGLLAGLAPVDWGAPTRCSGWDVADVVLHLTQTDDMAVASVEGRLESWLAHMAAGEGIAASVDAGADRMVERQRGAQPPPALRARWTAGADALVRVLAAADPPARVAWVAGPLSVRTLASTRLAETWIHAGDVAGAVGVELVPTDRLRHVARLAWRTLPYAFASVGRAMAGPVAFHLVSPEGDAWDFVPDGEARSVVWGPGAELCAVAARRVEAAATSLRAEGPDAESVLSLLRTYA